jgi:hypothetical protein
MAELGEKTPGMTAASGMRMASHLPTLAAAGTPRPRFHVPAPTPIVRVNLAKANPQPGYPSWAIGKTKNNIAIAHYEYELWLWLVVPHFIAE